MRRQVSLVSKVKDKIKGRDQYYDSCCKKCSLKKYDRYVPTQFVKDSKVLFIGEAPGREEVEQKKPFVGQSGKLLRKVLDKMDISYSVSNVCKCRPASVEGENRTPTKMEVRCCLPIIMDEVENFDFIVLVGGIALSVFFPEVNLGDVVGSVLIKKGKKYLVVYHPAYILRNREVEKDWIRDLGRVEDVLLERTENLGNKVVGKDIDINKVFSLLDSSNRLYLDIETTSLDRFDYKLICIGIAGEDTNIFVFPYTSDLVDKMNKLFRRKEVVIQNALFELGMLSQVGIRFDKSVIKDTMVMAHLLDEKRKGQKNLSRRLLGYRYWNLVVQPGDVPDEEVFVYNAEDVYVLRKLYQNLWGRLSNSMQGFSVKVLSNALKVISEIEDFGMKVDLDRLSKVKKKVMSAIDVLLEELSEYGDINWNSPQQVGTFLVDKGVSGFRKTGTGRISMDKEAVSHLLMTVKSGEVKNLLTKLKDYKKLETLKNTFLEGAFSKIGVKGRVRSSYSFVNTVSGRLSSSNPNLQNIPRDSRIRELFVPEEDCVFVEGDCGQVELRVCAIIAEDKVMIEAFKKGEDLHKLTASLVMGKEKEKVTKEERQKAKAVNFGFLYGQGWMSFKGFAKSEYGVELTDEEAQDWRNGFFGQYSGLAEWHKEIEDFVKRNGYVESKFGRKRRFENEFRSSNKHVVEHAVRQALNFPIQSVASDLNLLLMGKLFLLRNKLFSLDTVKFVETVHDEFMLEVKKDLVEDVIGMVDSVVESIPAGVPWFNIPFVVDVKVIDRWGK